MTVNRIQIGFLALGLLVVLVAIGCSSDSDLISSGNVLVTYPASTVRPTSIDYDCIRMNYRAFTIKPADGVCSDASGPEFAGLPCGSATDCTNAGVSCDLLFGDGTCVGGANNGLNCVGDLDCPDGTCVIPLLGECATLDGVFTGRECSSDLDCTPGSGEKCSGRCSAQSSNPGGPCVLPADCTLGDCVGAQAADTLGGNNITLINELTLGIPVFFTPTCPACELENTAAPVLCDPDNPMARCVGGGNNGLDCTTDEDCPNGECLDRCQTRCLTNEQLQGLGIPCGFDKCCQKFTLIASECEDDSDCPPNNCSDSSTPLPANVLPEGEYMITALLVSNLRMFASDAATETLECTNSASVGDQYDEPLTFVVGAGLPNEVRFVIDLTELEGLLGDPGSQAGCNAAFSDFPAWFDVVSN